jgi:hypothetical protein
VSGIVRWLHEKLAIERETQRLWRKAAIAFLREGAILLVVFGLIDGMTNHRELEEMGVDWKQWMLGLMVVGGVSLVWSVDLERKLKPQDGEKVES